MASGPKLVNIIYIRATPRPLWKALTEGKLTRRYYAGLDLHAGLKSLLETGWPLAIPRDR